MKYITIILILCSVKLSAQNILKFDKRNVQCENKWIAYKMDKDSTYTFGFIYIDPQAGLTFNYEGIFKIDKAGKFNKQISETSRNVNIIKVRLKPNKVAIAEIPESKFKELNIQKYPKWLENYKLDENSIEKLFRWGYLYNGWNEIEKALTYLEKAEKINPDYEGLQTELAFSYNALEKFDKAEVALNRVIKNKPNDCYSLKELAYTYNHLQKLEKSIELYYKMTSVCSEKDFIQETAYNLAFQYFQLKDKENFMKWSNEARKWLSENQYTKNLDTLEKEFK